MAAKVEKIIDTTQFGEGPHWDEESQSLYFVDMSQNTINRYVPATKKHTKAALGNSHLGLIIPVRGQKNKFLVALKKEIAVVTWDGESDKASEIEIILNNDNADSVGTQFNDGKCDPTGRLWLGTMFATDEELPAELPVRSSFYTFQGGHLKTLLTKVGISNGLAFNVELNKLYYIDSLKGSVDEFDLYLQNAEIDNRRPIFTFKRHDIPGSPDGMTIDADGNLWVAAMEGSRVIKIDPRKPETLLETVTLPAKVVTSVAFGGKNLDDLYVTTAKPWNGQPTPDDGCIYRVTGINARGLPGISVVL